MELLCRIVVKLPFAANLVGNGKYHCILHQVHAAAPAVAFFVHGSTVSAAVRNSFQAVGFIGKGFFECVGQCSVFAAAVKHIPQRTQTADRAIAQSCTSAPFS